MISDAAILREVLVPFGEYDPHLDRDVAYRFNIDGLEASCFLCRRRRRIHVHHIDECQWNNGPANLIALCIYCHGQGSRDEGRLRGTIEANMRERLDKRPNQPRLRAKLAYIVWLNNALGQLPPPCSLRPFKSLGCYIAAQHMEAKNCGHILKPLMTKAERIEMLNKVDEV